MFDDSGNDDLMVPWSLEKYILQVFGQDSRIGNSEPWALTAKCGWCSAFFLWGKTTAPEGFHQHWLGYVGVLTSN